MTAYPMGESRALEFAEWLPKVDYSSLKDTIILMNTSKGVCTILDMVDNITAVKIYPDARNKPEGKTMSFGSVKEHSLLQEMLVWPI